MLISCLCTVYALPDKYFGISFSHKVYIDRGLFDDLVITVTCLNVE
jgi:hypothetical protein